MIKIPLRPSISAGSRYGTRFLFATLLALFLLPSTLFSATYWVTENGVDNTSRDGLSQSQAWASLKFACDNVDADQGHTIRMGAGTFEDPARLTGNGSPATLPRNVNLIGAGKNQTIYKGQIDVPQVFDQVISDFTMDGSDAENVAIGNARFNGLIIVAGSHLKVRDMKIEKFYGNGLNFGFGSGISDSDLYRCELINLGARNKRGRGVNTGVLINSDIYDNTFIEERGIGGEGWAPGNTRYTNVRFFRNRFQNHKDIAAGWNKDGVRQIPFNVELFRIDCKNVEFFENEFDSRVSIVGKESLAPGRPYFSVRVANNRWTNTSGFAIEVAMHDMIIEDNYFHFAMTTDIDQGGGNYALDGSGTEKDNILINNNVFENVPRAAIYNLNGDDIDIFNNTVVGGRASEARESNPVLIGFDSNKPATRSNWQVANNVLSSTSARRGRFLDLASGTLPNLNMVNNAIYVSDSGVPQSLIRSSPPIVEHPMYYGRFCRRGRESGSILSPIALQRTHQCGCRDHDNYR